MLKPGDKAPAFRLQSDEDQVMRATRSQANPQAVNDILRKLLSETS